MAITRRSLAGAAGALVWSVASAGAAPTPPSADAELIELGRQLAAEWAKQDAWDATAHDVTDDEVDEAMAPARELVDRIESMQAHTLEGLMVKAQAISWCNSGDDIDPDRFCPYPGATRDGRIAASIVRNLLGEA